MSALLASCTSSGTPQFEVADPGFSQSGAAALTSVEGLEPGPAQAAAEAPAEGSAAGEPPAEPEQVAAAVPNAETPADTAAAAPSVAPAPAQVETLAAAESPTPQAAEPLAASAPQPQLVDKKKQTFLSAFFSGGTPKKSAAQEAVRPLIETATPAASAEAPAAEPAPAKPLIQLASAESEADRDARASTDFTGEALPGVRQTMLFEIKRKSGIDDDSDIDLNEAEGLGPVQLASAAGLARLAPNGLLKQRDSVDTACLKPSLVRMLKSAETRFGKKVVITSGYRSPAYNRKVRGAEKSQHMFCAAADILMPGVSKWDLAKHFRAMPGRGGVGTYCHTEAIHVDVGPERDWNWRCRRRG